MLLSRHCASDFLTRNISVDIDPSDRLIQLKPCGKPIDFNQLTKLRSRSLQQNGNHFIASNLGVSGHISVSFHGRRFLLLISQDRPDFGDHVLKLPSGYVSLEHLQNPIVALDHELAEELLFFNDNGLFPLQRDDILLPRPYPQIGYKNSCARLVSKPIKSLYNVRYEQTLLEGVECYHHQESGSVQLVYHWQLELPDIEFNTLNLWQLEERYVEPSQMLETHWEDRRLLWLAEINQHRLLSGGLYYVKEGLLLPHDEQRPLMLSEYFANRDGIRTQHNNLRLSDYRPYC